MKNTEYENLLNQYGMLSIEQLQEITIENGYTEIAQKAAKYIINNECYRKYEDNSVDNEETCQDSIANDIHQIAGDVRFMKNLTIVLIVNIIIYAKILG